MFGLRQFIIHFFPRIITIAIVATLVQNCSSANNLSSAMNEQFRPPVLQAPMVNEAVMAKFSRSCALCHINGEAGAPLVGDTDDWARRLQQGEDVIMKNVLEGVNAMPPLGYCMACEISDFRAMIAYMAGLNQ